MNKQERDRECSQNESWSCVAGTPPVTPTCDEKRFIDSIINDVVVLVGVDVGTGGMGGVGVGGFAGDGGCKH